MSSTRVAVIMAGGSGERFWPLSRNHHPKQLLRLADPDASLLQQAVGRLHGLIEPQHIFVATARHLQHAILEEGGLGIPRENIIAEPCKRNTTGCLCYAAAVLAKRYKNLPAHALAMAVLTADHCVGDSAAFRQCVQTALDASVEQQALVTIGIQPTRPETGYGYIEYERNGENLNPTGKPPVYTVIRFREKPGRQTARKFYEDGNFLWNSGMFFWTLETFVREISSAHPQTGIILQEMTQSLKAGCEETADACFAKLESISIDYALMEKARKVLVVPASFAWDDVGAWDALARTLAQDACGNVCHGDPIVIDTHDSIVYNAARKPVAVAAVGIKDLVVVVADDAVLVVPKDRVQDVKHAVSALREKGLNHV